MQFTIGQSNQILIWDDYFIGGWLNLLPADFFHIATGLGSKKIESKKQE